MSSRIKLIWLIDPFTVALILVTVVASCKRTPSSSGTNAPGHWESRIFKMYVLEPIPESVRDIKLNELETSPFGRRHGYVMRFKISKADVELILKSRGFEEFERATYRNGDLWWGNADKYGRDPRENPFFGTNVGNLPLYTGPNQKPPKWFTPNDWDNPKVYKYEQKWGKAHRNQTKVLIFNEELEEAYFIEDL
jgi:hypothetical protein